MAYAVHRNPWTAVWWSVALPGFGHLFMGQHAKGLILMSWEILVNHQAHLNTAIYLTLLGEYDKARDVLNYNWLIIYPLFYLFSMFDAYRTCVDLNNLTDRERVQPKRTFQMVSTTALGITMITRRNPVMAAFWSATITGFGQFYNDRGLKSLIMMGWYLAVVLKSGLSTAAFYTVTGRLDEVLAVLDFQWLLFWPSIWVFGVVEAYADTVEQNTLCDEAFRWRLRKYIRNGGEAKSARGI
jgi:TM2 domain-containing membrane protein YozV